MKARTIFVAAALLLAAALPATADVTLTVTATTDQGTVAQQFLIECPGSVVEWTLASPVDIMDGDVLLATITELTLETDSEPYVNLFFALQAGASDTTVSVTSPVISFSPMLNPQAYASAGITLTSDSDGATITGLFGGKNYEARYNGTTVYADLVAGFSIPGDQTVTSSDRSPASGYNTITGTVSSIESEFNFTLSALDQASGTSRFEVIPEPCTLGLLTLGGLALLRRRRK